MRNIRVSKRTLKIAAVLAAVLLTATILTAAITTTNQSQRTLPLINAYLQGAPQGSTSPITEKAIGTIYIWYDYTFTSNINNGSSIIVNGSNIVINGNGCSLIGPGTGAGCGFNLTNVNHVTIKNTVVTGWNTGVYLYNSKNDTLTGNIVTKNSNYGFELDSSSDYNNISGNKASTNALGGAGVGIFLLSSSYNTITSNYADNNTNGAGIYLLSSSNHNTISGNTAFNNTNGAGIFLQDNCNNNIISGNNATFNTNGNGFAILASSNYNTLSGNIANNNGKGFTLYEGSSYNSISSNTANDNTQEGFYLYYNSNYNTLTGNTANTNGGDGFELYNNSNYNTLSGNTANNNDYNGFALYYSSNYNNLTGNNANNNTDDGFFLMTSSGNNNLSNNLAANNQFCGFNLNTVYNNKILDNIALNNTNKQYAEFFSSGDDFTGSVEAYYLRVYVTDTGGQPLSGVDVQVVSNGTIPVWYDTPYFGGPNPPTGSDGLTPWFAAPYKTFITSSTETVNNVTVTVWYSDLWNTAVFAVNPQTEIDMHTSTTVNFTVASWQPTSFQKMLPWLLLSAGTQGGGNSPLIYAAIIGVLGVVLAGGLIYYFSKVKA